MTGIPDLWFRERIHPEKLHPQHRRIQIEQDHVGKPMDLPIRMRGIALEISPGFIDGLHDRKRGEHIRLLQCPHPLKGGLRVLLNQPGQQSPAGRDPVDVAARLRNRFPVNQGLSQLGSQAIVGPGVLLEPPEGSLEHHQPAQVPVDDCRIGPRGEDGRRAGGKGLGLESRIGHRAYDDARNVLVLAANPRDELERFGSVGSADDSVKAPLGDLLQNEGGERSRDHLGSGIRVAENAVDGQLRHRRRAGQKYTHLPLPHERDFRPRGSSFPYRRA